MIIQQKCPIVEGGGEISVNLNFLTGENYVNDRKCTTGKSN